MSALLPRKVYFLGIAGQMVSAIACIAKSRGVEVWGSDQGAYPPATDYLKTHSIPYTDGHKIENIGQPDLIVLANHIRHGNVELDYILKHNLPYVSFPQFIAKLFPNPKYCLVVAGTHGKSTTTSLLGWILDQAALNPTVLLGATSKNFSSSFRLGSEDILVLEGDEYTSSCQDPTPKILYYHPTHAIITSIELDHVDIFDSLDKQNQVFIDFAAQTPNLIIHTSITAITAPHQTYGLTNAAWQAVPTQNGFIATHNGQQIADFVFPLPGEHYIEDALSAVSLCLQLHIPIATIKSALASFKGVSRRFDIQIDSPNLTVIDDYAHHPTAIKATLKATKYKYPNRPIVAIYEPHTYSRIKGLLNEFEHSFDSADLVLISDIYAAREKNLAHTVSVDQLLKAISHPNSHHLATPTDIIKYLRTNLPPQAVIVCMSVSPMDNLAATLSHLLQ